MTEKRLAIDTGLPVHLLLLQIAALIQNLAVPQAPNGENLQEFKDLFQSLSAIESVLRGINQDQLHVIRAAEIRSILQDKYLSYSLPSILSRLQMDKPELQISELGANLLNLRQALIKISLRFSETP